MQSAKTLLVRRVRHQDAGVDLLQRIWVSFGSFYARTCVDVVYRKIFR